MLRTRPREDRETRGDAARRSGPDSARDTWRRPAADTSVTRQRFRRRRLARRWVVLRRVLLALAAVACVVGGVWLVFFSSVLAVSGAEVRGTDVLTSREVARAAEVPVGEPLATADLAAVRARVEDLVAVDSAQVSRDWPDRVRIEVTERTPVAAVSWEGQWRGLDDDGVLFRTWRSRPPGLPRVEMVADTPVEALAGAAGVIAALPADVARRLDHLEVRTVDSITLHLRGGVLVHWGSGEQSADKARVLEVLLRQPARVYDVTAPGRPTLLP